MLMEQQAKKSKLDLSTVEKGSILKLPMILEKLKYPESWFFHKTVIQSEESLL